uniref:Metalloendopeptidase n=1 Tax=Daphnia galeata TaxID=27404 RepID=A0A8J2WJ59_9CRUS|nr:unnamed protein product [Daphnia galeata]
MSKKLVAVVLTFVFWGCWAIPGITGTPVGELEMGRNFGSPITTNELNCIPTFGKAETGTPSDEGNDIVMLPNKNAYVTRKWPNPKKIPYVVDSSFGKASEFFFNAKARCAIGFAMNQYHKNTCIRFVPRTNETDYIQINRLDTQEYGEGAHHVTLSPSCYAYQAGTIMHELMHRVGFHHEHTRPDRDSYIAILWDNISNAWKAQYEIAKGSALISSYDYGSVMHYPLSNSMRTKKATGGVQIGQRKAFSAFTRMSKKLVAVVLTFVFWGCWAIPGITGTPVGELEMGRNFGSPITTNELNCIPTFGKAGKLSP